MVRMANAAACAFLLVATIGMLLAAQRRAAALTEGPCPGTLYFGGSCGPYTVYSYTLKTGVDCARCDPFWVTQFGQPTKYYHCAEYDRKNQHCVDMSGYDYIVGYWQVFTAESSGSSTCYPNYNGPGQGHCLSD